MEIKLYTIEEVAQMMSVNHMTIRRWINNGQIAAIRLPGGGIRISQDEVTRIISTVITKTETNV